MNFCSYEYSNMMRCAIWYYLYNLKNVKNTHQLACNFTKINTPPWVFFTFFKLYKSYQIVQSTTNMMHSLNYIFLKLFLILEMVDQNLYFWGSLVGLRLVTNVWKNQKQQKKDFTSEQHYYVRQKHFFFFFLNIQHYFKKKKIKKTYSKESCCFRTVIPKIYVFSS